MNHKYFPFLIMTLLILTKVAAQSITTLPQAIHSAFNNRKSIQAGKIDLTIQQLKTKALFRKYRPQISAQYNYNYNPILQSSIIPLGKFNSALPPDATANIQFGSAWSQSAGLTVSQPLFDASTKNIINESLLQEKIYSAAQAQTEYDLAYEVSKAYINIFLQQQQINSAIIDTARTWLSYQLQFEKYNSGRLIKSDLNKAIINHNNTKQILMDATMQLLENTIYLMFLTGITANEIYRFTIDTSFFNSNNQLMSERKDSPDSIPALQQLDFQKKLSILQQQTEKSKYLPVVSIKGFLGANQFSNDFNPVKSNSWFGYSYIGLDIKIPLLLGEDVRKKTAQLQLQSQQFDKQKQDKLAQYQYDTTTAILEMERIKIKSETLEANRILYQESLKISQERLREGQITSLELNQQEYELQQISAEYESTNRQLWLTRLSYLEASGQLSKLWR